MALCISAPRGVLLLLPSNRFGRQVASCFACCLSTVNFISHVGRFCCRRPLIEINTSLESSWSMNLISVGLGSNRGILSELGQIIVCADNDTNRSLQPRVSADSSTVPYNFRDGKPQTETRRSVPRTQ